MTSPARSAWPAVIRPAPRPCFRTGNPPSPRVLPRPKIDAPSGTARELAARLSKVRAPEPTVPVEQTVGLPEACGATISGSQIHAVRLPGS